MPASLLPLSPAPVAAPSPRPQASDAAAGGGFGAALGGVTFEAAAPVLVRGSFAAPAVLNDAASVKSGRGGIFVRDDAKAKRPGGRGAALPEAALPQAGGSPAPPAALAPAAKPGAGASAKIGVAREDRGVSVSVQATQDAGPAASLLPPADGPAVSPDKAAGPSSPPRAASAARGLADGKPAVLPRWDGVTPGGSALPSAGGNVPAGDDFDDGTQDEAAPAVAAGGPASIKPHAVEHELVGPEPRAVTPAADVGGGGGLPAPVQIAAGGGDPQPVAGTPVAAGVPAPLASGTQPQAATAAAPPAAAASPAEPAAQLGQAVAALHVGAGSSGHVSIRLDPEALGGVRIDVRRGEDGVAAVTLTVERAQTLHALQTDLSHLHQALDRAGVPAEQRTISLHLATPEDQGGGRDAAAGGGGRSGQQGEPQQRAPSPARFAAGGERAGWQPGLSSAPPRASTAVLLRAGFDITA